jgi:L-asparaginase II
MTDDHGHPPPHSASPAAPVLVEMLRGELVESRHRGHAVVIDGEGRIVAAWGDPEILVYPRSAIKAVQALPLLESGAADAFGLSAIELALACSSHHGEIRHVRMAQSWLNRIGCQIGDLECGPHPPLDEEAAAELIRAGQTPTALHNNCSGKHLGMLTTARHLGEPLVGYTRPDHPVQQRIRAAIQQMARQRMEAAPEAVDGCSAPTLGLPLRALAMAMVRFASAASLPAHRVSAIDRLRDAWGRHPYLIGGRTSLDTRVIQTAPGVLLKGGAEGCGVAVLLRPRLAVAIKIEDGAGRARDVAVLALLHHLGVLDAVRWHGLKPLAVPLIRNCAGIPVGMLRPAAGWLDHDGKRE